MSDSIQIDTGKVKTIAVSMGDVRTQIVNEFNELTASVANLRNGWKTDGGAASHVAEAAIKVFGQINEQHMDMVNVQLEQMIKYLYEAVGEQYEATEEKNKDNAGIGEAKPNAGVSGGTSTGGSVTGAVTGGTVAGGIVSGGTTSGNTGATNRPAQVGDVIGYSASGAPRYKLSDYVYQGLYRENGVFGEHVYCSDGSCRHAVATWNYYNHPKYGTELSCTYYTLRKLNERGLSYPCHSAPGNGSNWYNVFDANSGAKGFGGGNALYDLANNMALPQENIVVSFSSNPSSDPEIKRCGHVMLIDKMYRDENGSVMVVYSDNSPKITNVNGSNPQKAWRLEDFMSHYNYYNGSINGAVVVGAGDGVLR